MCTELYFFPRRLWVHWSEKLNVNRCSYETCFNTGLNALDCLPFGVISTSFEFIDKLKFFDYFNEFNLVFVGKILLILGKRAILPLLVRSPWTLALRGSW